MLPPKCWVLPLLALLVSAETPENPLSVYDEGQALQFLEFARVSFCDDLAISNWICGEACHATKQLVARGHVKIIGPGEEAGVKGYVTQLRDGGRTRRCVLAYRGSVNVENWFADAKLMLFPWPAPRDGNATGAPKAEWCKDCKVHGGFADAYEELRNETLAALGSLGCELVDVTGHSLGAGVATIATADLRANGVHIRMLWTFGSPRVGNPAFVKAFMAQAKSQGAPVASWRVVHYHDPVPHGGPSEFYMHLPNQVYYSQDSSAYEVCPPVTWDGDAVVRPQCGMHRLDYKDMTAGLLMQDHVNYINRTLAVKQMDAKCHFSNYCLRNGLKYNLLEMVAACLVSAALGATLTPFAWRRMAGAKRDYREHEDDSETSEWTSES